MSSVNGISQAATAISQAQLSNKVGFAVLNKQQDAAKLQGDAAVQLIETAASIGKGNPVDILDLSQE